MKLRYFTVLALFLVGSFFSCESDGSYELVQGQWKAMAMDQNGEIKDYTNRDVWFKFNPDGTYEYSTNNSYRESGKYRMRTKVLYTTDTISGGRIEKAVRLAVINNDSIHFEMNSKGVAQTLRLSRTK